MEDTHAYLNVPKKTYQTSNNWRPRLLIHFKFYHVILIKLFIWAYILLKVNQITQNWFLNNASVYVKVAFRINSAIVKRIIGAHKHIIIITHRNTDILLHYVAI